jgi:hypothetical protein
MIILVYICQDALVSRAPAPTPHTSCRRCLAVGGVLLRVCLCYQLVCIEEESIIT